MPAESNRPEEDWVSACMALACGEWGWPPESFWRATPFDVGRALKGLLDLRGAQAGFSARAAADLRARLDSEIRGQKSEIRNRK